MMTEHKCGGKWVEGKVSDCPKCRPPSSAAPAYLPENYKESTRSTIKDSRGSRETLHWSGRQDALIKPSPVRATGRAKEK